MAISRRTSVGLGVEVSVDAFISLTPNLMKFGRGLFQQGLSVRFHCDPSSSDDSRVDHLVEGYKYFQEQAHPDLQSNNPPAHRRSVCLCLECDPAQLQNLVSETEPESSPQLDFRSSPRPQSLEQSDSREYTSGHQQTFGSWQA